MIGRALRVKLSAVEGRGGRRVVDESCWLVATAAAAAAAAAAE